MGETDLKKNTQFAHLATDTGEWLEKSKMHNIKKQRNIQIKKQKIYLSIFNQ